MDAARRFDHVRGARDVHDDPELVASEPRDGVAVPQASAQPRAERTEQLITVRMTERVVDLLEPIQVEEEHSRAPAASARTREDLLDSVGEEAPIRQAREAVVQREVLDLADVGTELACRATEHGEERREQCDEQNLQHRGDRNERRADRASDRRVVARRDEGARSARSEGDRYHLFEDRALVGAHPLGLDDGGDHLAVERLERRPTLGGAFSDERRIRRVRDDAVAPDQRRPLDVVDQNLLVEQPIELSLARGRDRSLEIRRSELPREDDVRDEPRVPLDTLLRVTGDEATDDEEDRNARHRQARGSEDREPQHEARVRAAAIP